MASLSAELSAERRVSEESREQVAIARAQANKYQAQVRVQLLFFPDTSDGVILPDRLLTHRVW